jgi:hypothetical protein
MIIPLAISVSVLGGICTWLALATGTFLIWGAFVAWACFYHCGGDGLAFRTTIVSNLFGVVVAWTAGLALASLQPAAPLAAVIVAVSIAVYILAAFLPPFASIPSVTYGYACTFAFLTQNPDAFTRDVMLSLGARNALLLVPLSMIIGACFAYASALLAGRLGRAISVGAVKAT